MNISLFEKTTIVFLSETKRMVNCTDIGFGKALMINIKITTLWNTYQKVTLICSK
jgi:hypothetical protein